MEAEPGTIIRDRYVLTAPFGEPADAAAWRAVDMVLRRRVVVVFDPPPDDAESEEPIPIDRRAPEGVPVGEVLDAGHAMGSFYRVFRTAADGTDDDVEPVTAADDADPVATGTTVPLAGDIEDTVVVPFASSAIDGTDATRPMNLPAPAAGFQPPPLDAVPLPVDPTTELPAPPTAPWRPALATITAAGAGPGVVGEPEPAGTAPARIKLPERPNLAAPAGHHRRAGRERQPAGHPFPIAVTAITVAAIAGLSSFLLVRPEPSDSAPTPPPAAAGTVATTTTTTTVPPTTTTLPPPSTTTTLAPRTTWRRRATVTVPPETYPPQTAPPTTTPAPTTTQRRSTTTEDTTTRTKPDLPDDRLFDLPIRAQETGV